MDAAQPQAFRHTIQQCGAQLASALTYEQRLQLMAFLCGIAKADGTVTTDEVEALREVAQYMMLQQSEVDSLLNLGGSSLEDAYKVLEVSPDATDQEVRAAYRRLALKHHPDKVAMLGDDVKRAAEEKFQQINNAKERIYKARGMK
jgi:DnaJ like chaperone protein